MKRLVSIAAAISTVLLGTAVSAQTYISGGGIEIGGNVNTAREGDIVTISVFKDGAKWENEEFWTGENSDKIVYCKEGKLNAERAYNFSFYLDESGKYVAMIGSDEFPNIKTENIVYINKTKNDAALAALSAAQDAAETAKVLADKKADLGLFDEFYNRSDFSKEAEILFSAIKGKTLEYESATELIDKACLAADANSGKTIDSEEFKNRAHMDETLTKYYKSENLSDLLSMLKDDKSSSITDFENNLTADIVLCTINKNDGTGEIKNVLNDYAAKYDFDKSKFETGLYSALADAAAKKPFSKIADVTDFIKEYKKSGSNTGGGNGGGGGGGGSLGGNSSKPPLSGAELPVYEVPDNMSDASKIFSDLSDVEWASEAIEDLYIKGVINGTGENEFSPNLNVKREEFAKMLTKAFKVDLVSTEQYFDDVAPDDWCYDFVNSLYLSGAANGVSEKLFGKGEDITRQDLCVMICRMADIAKGSFENVNASAEFSDGNEIADYAKEAVGRMQTAGIISGYDDNSFRPNGFATRAEAAKIIYETLVRITY